MLERYFRHPRVLGRIAASSHSQAIREFVVYLGTRGHSRNTIQGYTQAVEHFFTWLDQNRKSLACDSVREFLAAHLPDCSCPPPAPRHLITNRTALKLLLRSANMPLVNSPSRDSDRGGLVSEYDVHLQDNAGLANETRRYRVRNALEFLDWRFPPGSRVRIDRITPKDITNYIGDRASKLKRSSLKVATCSLRSFLRFLKKQSLVEEGLVRSVPWIPQWKLSSIPQFMSDDDFDQFLNCFDQASSTGARDYAMALCMVELGLRVSEIALMQLTDLDWRSGCMVIQSVKGRCQRTMPLPKNIGEAITAYLQSERPKPLCKNVFLRHSVPAGTAVTRELARGVIRRAYIKIGRPEWTGTHLLRHTAATRLHQRGVPLKEIADLLGHRCIDTSKIYTKIDLSSLEKTALPWPEVRS